MKQRLLPHAQRRLKVGRTQVFSASAYRLRNVIQWENYIWIYILLSFFVVQIFLSNAVKTLFQTFENNPLPLITNLSIIITVYATLLGRIIYNILIRSLLEYGMSRDKHILNNIVSFINSIIALSLFAIVFYIALFNSIIIFSSRESLWKLFAIQENTDFTVFLSIFFYTGISLALVFLTLFLFINSVRSIINFVHSFILLPAERKISNELCIKNYHYFDKAKIEKIYVDSKNKEYPHSTFDSKDYEIFLQAADPLCIRVLLKQGEAIGFYLTSHNRSVIETMLIDPLHRGQNLHMEFLKDFEEIAHRRMIQTIKANILKKDTRTIELLKDNGWKEQETDITEKTAMLEKCIKK